MSEQDPASLSIDTTTPNVARIYDYLLLRHEALRTEWG